MVLISASGKAATYTWTGGTGTFDWSLTSGSWSTSGVPDGDDEVVITGISGTLTFTNASGVTLSSLTVTDCSDLSFGMDVTVSTGTLTITDSEVSFSGDLTATGSQVSITSSVSSTPPYGTTIDVAGSIAYTGSLSVTLSKVNMASAADFTITTTGTISIFSSVFGNYISSFTCTNTSGTDSGSSQALKVSSCIFEGKLSLKSKTLRIQNNSLVETVVVKETPGANTTTAHSSQNSGNVFDGKATFINNDPYGYLLLGSGDVFNDEVLVRNKSTNDIYIGANTSVTTTGSFKNHVSIYNHSSGTVHMAYSTNASLLFDNATLAGSTDTAFICLRNCSSGKIRVGVSGNVSFTYAKVIAGNLGSGTVEIGPGANSSITFNSSAVFRVYPDDATAPYDSLKFAGGALSMDRVVFNNNTADKTKIFINQSSDAQISISPACVFDRKLEISTGKFNRIGGTFKGETVFINLVNATGYSTSMLGTTTFSNHVSFISHSAYFWYLANVGSPNLNIVNFNSDDVDPEGQAHVLVHQEGNGQIALGYQNGTFNFSNVLLTLKRFSDTNTPGYINVAYVATMTVNLDAQSSVKVVQSQINSGIIRLGYGGLVTHYGTIDASEQTGDLFVLNYFTSKNSDLEIITSPSAGNSTTVSLSANCTFDGDLEVKSPGITSSGGLYKGNTLLNRFGSTTGQNVHTGSPVYKGNLTLKNESEGNLWLATGASDVFTFEKNVYIIQGAGTTKGARLGDRGICYYYGDLSYDGDINSVLFGANGGQNIFVGSLDQTISTTGANAYRMGRLEVDKPSGNLILNAKVLISNVYNGTTASYPAYLALTDGNIVTTSGYLLTLNNDATIEGGGRHSFVDGPLSKIGDDTFKFFVGKGMKYFPVSISAPSATNATFTAEFMDAYQSQGTMLDAGLKDALNCQYWKIDKTNSSDPVDVTLFWNNEAGQICYPVNHNLVCVARYNSGTSSWQNEGQTMVHDYNPSADSGYVASSESFSDMGYFALGYNNALVLNTQHVNPTKFKVYNHMEPLDAFSVYPFTSGPEGSAAGDKTILSSLKNIPGSIVIHPDFESTVDLQIHRSLSGSVTDVKAGYANYLPLEGKINTNASGSADVVADVEIDEDGDDTFLPLLGDVHAISGNTLFFYKEKPALETFDLSNNLEDAVTYTVNRYLTTPYTPFQITSSVPSGYSATLKIYDSSDNNFYTNTTDLKWDGKVSGTEFYPEGFYRYEVILSDGSTTKIYNAQLILKHQ